MLQFIVKTIRSILRFLGHLIPAVLATVFLGVVFQTQRVISMMKDVGGAVSFSDRLSMSVYDLQHLGSLYGIFIFIGLFVAMIVALGLFRFAFKRRDSLGLPLFVGAGMIAMLVVLFGAKKAFFDVHIIAGARDSFGLLLQALAGGVGGYVFYKLRRDLSQETTQV